MLTSRHRGTGFPEKSANAITATAVHAVASTMATQCRAFLLISFILLSYHNSAAPQGRRITLIRSSADACSL